MQGECRWRNWEGVLKKMPGQSTCRHWASMEELICKASSLLPIVPYIQRIERVNYHLWTRRKTHSGLIIKELFVLSQHLSESGKRSASMEFSAAESPFPWLGMLFQKLLKPDPELADAVWRNCSVIEWRHSRAQS